MTAITMSLDLQFPRPRHRRVRDEQPSAPTPPATVTVVSVSGDGSFYGAIWEFSEPITLDGANVPELEIDGEGLGFIGPDEVQQIGPTRIHGDYFSSSGIEVGDAWRILTPPAHLAPAVSAPQSGNLI